MVVADLIFHVTLQDQHVNKGPYDFAEGNCSLYIHTLPSLAAIGIVVMNTWF